MSEQEQKNQDILKKDAIIKDMQAKLVLLRNALIEERKKANALDEKNKEYINQITKLEKVIISKETEITNLTRDMLDLQEAISLEKSKNVDGSVKNVFKSVSHIFQKEGNAITEVENKKLQTTINDLKDENERIVNENKKLKTNLEEIKKTNDYQINELTIKNNKMEQSVLDKNQQIDEFMKRLELIRVADNQNMNEKKNLEIKISDLQNRNKKLKEEVDKTNNENNNQKEKINKIELKNPLQNNMKLESFNSTNYPRTINKSVSMNNSVYNFPMGNKKSSSVNKLIKLNDYQNMTLLNNYPNLMTISLSQGKDYKFNKMNGNNLNNINNISTTFYSFKNNANKNPVVNKIPSINSNNNLSKKNKYNYMSMLPNNYLGGYKTFFNKNNANDKYNYDINTNYFKEELKKYNSNAAQNYYNNVIDENDEYTNSTNSNNINTKNIYNNNNNNNNKLYKKKNYLNDKKDGKLMNKYKDNNFFSKYNMGGKINKKPMNGYGTLYNYGYGKKKNNVELPQLMQIYNKNGLVKNNNHYYDLPYNKKY